MADTKFTAGAIVPALEVWGGYQRFEYNDHFVKLQAYNKFLPFGSNSSVVSIESLNNNLAGFRFRHVTSSSSPNNYGTFALNFFNNAADTTGTEIFLYDTGSFYFRNPVFMQEDLSMGSKKIVSLAAGVAGTDAVNVAQMNAAISIGGSISLTGDVTGSGTVGTPFATVLALRLNQILSPTASVSMSSQKITSLANGTVSTDAINLGQMTSAIAAGTITLTGNVTGSGTVGSSFATTLALRLNQILTPTAAVSMNSQKLTSLANGTVSADGVNLGQMNTAISSAVSAGTITLTGNVTGSGTIGSPFATTIVSKLNQIPIPTGTININSQDLVSVSNLGISVASPTFGIQFPNTVDDCKICFYQNAANSFQVYGIGVLGSTLKYSVGNSVASHVFYCGASSTTSTELFRIHGTGYATVSGGDGTFYSRVPSIQINNTGASTTTVTSGSWVKLNFTSTAAATGAVQFTTSTNRITFTGSDLGTVCYGMATASVDLRWSTVGQINLGIAKNGSIIPQSSVWVANTSTSIPVTANIPLVMTDLSPGDYLEIWVLGTTLSPPTVTTISMTLSFRAC